MLSAAREKQCVRYKGNTIKLSADFSAEILQARREWHNIFKVPKEKYFQPRILYPVRFSFRIEGNIKNFPDNQRIKKFTNINLALQEMLMGLL